MVSFGWWVQFASMHFFPWFFHLPRLQDKLQLRRSSFPAMESDFLSTSLSDQGEYKPGPSAEIKEDSTEENDSQDVPVRYETLREDVDPGEVLAEVSGNNSPKAIKPGLEGGRQVTNHSPSSDKENESEKLLVVNLEGKGKEMQTQEHLYKPRRKISNYITDRAFRIKSFQRRRSIPLKRLADLDRSCGTKSFLLQVNPEVDEAVYYGVPSLVERFLSKDGLKLSDVNAILQSSKGRVSLS